MKIALPELSLVVLVGASGAGKSTFARRHFLPTEVVSSDAYRGWVSDDETDQSATTDAFEVLHMIVGKRLRRGRLTVVDATSTQPEARRLLLEIAREHDVQPVAIVFDLPEGLLTERNRNRRDRRFGPHVLRNQRSQLRRSLPDLQKEGFHRVWILRSPAEVEAVTIERRPLGPASPVPELNRQQIYDDVLDLEDVAGKRAVATRLRGNVTIREGNAAAALEVMSRFAVDPHWLIYLPPTMSPSETSRRPGSLEDPAEAFAHFRAEGVETVVCEEKHMGSRAVVVVCRDADSARRRFGLTGPRSDTNEIGRCYTRTGRPFFDEPRLEGLEKALLVRVRDALSTAGLWERLSTDWVCLDCELMPWSAKAQDLLRNQYAAVGAAARMALPKAVARLAEAGARGLPEVATAALLSRYRERYDLSGRFVEAYRRYCWPVNSIHDLKLAPFHLLASEGAVHLDRDHLWHMETLAELASAPEADTGLILATRYRVVDLADPASEAEATRWWEEMTAAGGEGMVVKPLGFVARGRRGIAQPALKCRGREYLRLLYGPDYTLPENLERLRERGLSTKRSLALREFALGIEALERFVRREPLRRVHECVFGVLALESEPVDPRL